MRLQRRLRLQVRNRCRSEHLFSAFRPLLDQKYREVGADLFTYSASNAQRRILHSGCMNTSNVQFGALLENISRAELYAERATFASVFKDNDLYVSELHSLRRRDRSSSRSLWRAQRHHHVSHGAPFTGVGSLWRIVGDQSEFCLQVCSVVSYIYHSLLL